jgi:hypothetical protein
MLKINILGGLGKYRYANLPDDIAVDLIKIGIDQAYYVASQKVPVLSGKLKSKIETSIYPEKKIGFVFIRKNKDMPYPFAAEYGTKNRLAHPFVRPAQKSAQSKIKAIMRYAARKRIEEEKARGVR